MQTEAGQSIWGTFSGLSDETLAGKIAISNAISQGIKSIEKTACI